MHALIDGDILLYRCGYGAENESEEVAIHRLNNLISKILEETKASSHTIYLSDSRDATFRAKLNPEYKGNRKSAKPIHYQLLKDYLINEYFGEKGVKKLSLITAALIAYCFVLLYAALKIPAVHGQNLITDSQFTAVFGQSMWIIVGSITAFLVSQLIDVTIFHYVKNRTGNKMIWLRSTGSTVISQLFDSFIVLGIAFWMTGKMTTEVFILSAN